MTKLVTHSYMSSWTKIMYHEIIDIAYSNIEIFMEHKVLIATLLPASGLAEIVSAKKQSGTTSPVYIND